MAIPDRDHLPLHPPPQNRNDLDDDEVTQYEHSGRPVEIWIPFNGRRDDFTIEIDADGNQTGIIKFYRPEPWELQQSVAVRPDPEPTPVPVPTLEPEPTPETAQGRDDVGAAQSWASGHVSRQAEKQRLLDEGSIRDRARARD